jgi:hypothetical protein
MKGVLYVVRAESYKEDNWDDVFNSAREAEKR